MRPTASHFCRIQGFAALLALGVFLSGCSWLKSLKPTESNAAFPDWSQSMSGSVRGTQGKKEAKPSGLLFDERSQEIEKNLGGGY